MSRSRAIWLSLLAWLAVGGFWLVVTRGYHPTLLLAVIVTAALMTAYASAVYVHHLLLIPRYWRTGRPGMYALGLVVTMVGLTGLALAVIRTLYLHSHGPDPDPNGVYVHFAIDLFGMAVHLLGAAGVVWAINRRMQK
ncbi:MAG: hypothetical protein K1X57_11065 [Gemmataceae bacterium]|nr:hypothetical protein [Gemmataceae bacterium]